MNETIEISPWIGPDGKSPVTDYYLSLSPQDKARIAKYDDKYEQFTFQQFVRTPYFETIKGHKGFWELKYLGKGGFNYRVVCVVYQNKIIGLVMFHGSGSSGKVSKHIPLAKLRAKDLSRII